MGYCRAIKMNTLTLKYNVKDKKKKKKPETKEYILCVSSYTKLRNGQRETMIFGRHAYRWLPLGRRKRVTIKKRYAEGFWGSGRFCFVISVVVIIICYPAHLCLKLFISCRHVTFQKFKNLSHMWAFPGMEQAEDWEHLSLLFAWPIPDRPSVLSIGVGLSGPSLLPWDHKDIPAIAQLQCALLLISRSTEIWFQINLSIFPLECKLHKGKPGSCSLIYLQDPTQHLPLSSCSINICWINK